MNTKSIWIMRRFILGAFAAILMAAISGPVLAATKGATVGSVNLRAGPGTGYPVVMAMPPSAALTIYGCLDTASWCDVSWGGARGWVSSNYVRVYYQGQTVTISPALIPMVGLTVVAFNQAYWNNHYVGQPWYGQWNSYYAGPGAVARSGCVGAACGGSGVVRGPYGGGAAARGACGPDRCAGGAIVRQPGGGVQFRRGVVER
ncbi:MAG: SH3 domain-containing protein [Allorhizobium sp.]